MFWSYENIIGEYTSAFHLHNYCSTRNSEPDYDIDDVVGTIGKISLQSSRIFLLSLIYFRFFFLNLEYLYMAENIHT